MATIDPDWQALEPHQRLLDALGIDERELPPTPLPEPVDEPFDPEIGRTTSHDNGAW